MALFASFTEPGFWLVLALIGAVVLLVARHYVPSPWRSWFAPLYWLLLPYLALLFGAVSPRLMGIYWIDWRTTFQVGAGLLLAIVALAAIAWLFTTASAQVPPAQPAGAPPAGAPPAGAQAVRDAPAPGAVHAVTSPHPAAGVRMPADARVGTPAARTGWTARLALIGRSGAEEWFWCFLRAALWEIALSLPATAVSPIYWSAWGAALLALPLALLLQPNGPLRLIKLVILAVTTVVFLYTRNFWLCWLVHATLALLFTPTLLRAAPTPSASKI
jgi:hypothetical protein